MTVKPGKYLKSGVLQPGKAFGAFVFEATLVDGTSRTFAGEAVGDRKRLWSAAPAAATCSKTTPSGSSPRPARGKRLRRKSKEAGRTGQAS